MTSNSHAVVRLYANIFLKIFVIAMGDELFTSFGLSLVAELSSNLLEIGVFNQNVSNRLRE